MADETLRYELNDKVAVLSFDDGKANAISHAVIDAFHGALDRAEKEARALLLVGRPGRLSAGFDLGTMRAGPEAVRGLVTAGAELLLRLYAAPLPTVTACTGHALAAGAILLLSSDTRLGAEGEFKIGLNEVGIGMTLPVFAIELARERLAKPHFQQAALQARIYDPTGAREAGFLDRVTSAESLFDEALAEARRLAELRTEAYRDTKQRARGSVVERIRATLAEDVASLTGPTGA